MHYSAICNNGEAVKRNEGMRTIKFCRAVIVQNKSGHRNTWELRKVVGALSVLLSTLGFIQGTNNLLCIEI